MAVSRSEMAAIILPAPISIVRREVPHIFGWHFPFRVSQLRDARARGGKLSPFKHFRDELNSGKFKVDMTAGKNVNEQVGKDGGPIDAKRKMIVEQAVTNDVQAGTIPNYA